MNLKDYLAKRKKEKNEFEAIPRRKKCRACLRPPEFCLCSMLTEIDTQFEFRILMHPKEYKKEPIGTGKYTNKILKKSKLIIDATFDENKELQNLIHNDRYQCFLLYPGEESINISKEELAPNLEPHKIPMLFIIDGTWACAKAMMRDSLCLHHLPRISFDHSITSRFHIKLQPADYCLSTIESVYVLLAELEKQGIENIGDDKEILLKTLDQLVTKQVECANDPNRKGYRRGTFKTKEQRSIPKKWDYRKICYEEKNYDH